MKKIPILLTLTVPVALLASASISQAALADWQNQVTTVGTTPAATKFTPTSGTAPVQVDVGTLSGDSTFEFIVNAGLAGDSSALLGSRGGGPTGNLGLKFEQWQNTTFYGVTAFGVIDLTSTAPASVGVDTHVAFVSDGTTKTDLYVNGVLAYSFGAAGALTLSGSQGLAGIFDTGAATPYFDVLDGNILGFASYDSALSADEIAAHYTSFVVPEPSTFALFALAGLGVLARRYHGRRSL